MRDSGDESLISCLKLGESRSGNAPKGRRGTDNMNSPRQRAWRRVELTFPERQIYIRSEERVQFLTFSSQMQAILVGISLLFLGWVAFTSVNVIFKDRILAAKEQ